MIADELSDPARDCKKFDQSKRARELFNALDDDGNGFLTEDEFITGCMSDEAFVKVCYVIILLELLILFKFHHQGAGRV